MNFLRFLRKLYFFIRKTPKYSNLSPGIICGCRKPAKWKRESIGGTVNLCDDCKAFHDELLAELKENQKKARA